MMRTKTVFLLLVFVFNGHVLTSAAPNNAEPTPASSLQPLEWLTGGTWSGDLPAQPGAAPMRIELRAEWTQNRKALRFDSTFIQGTSRMPYTSGFYVWNPATNQIEIFYVDDDGAVTVGPVQRDGAIFRHDLMVKKSKDVTDHVQVILTKRSEQEFTNEISVEKDHAWAKLVTVDYKRADQKSVAAP